MSENREYISRSEEHGDIYISEEVLAMIAGVSAMEVDGVTGLVGSNLGEQLLPGKKQTARGVAVQRDETGITINVSILIQYGYAIPEVAKKVQNTVCSNVEATCGLAPNAVNIRVGGVTFDKAPPQA